MPVDEYLPTGLARSDVRACLALVSDTHMPQRCRALPAALFDVLAGADLLLHAGDVGELWVLDQLSAIAPVLAVHGNDETAAATAHLPYELLVSVDGERVFVWHSHHRDWRDERAARTGDALLPKLQRTIDRAGEAGASLALFGHWHIPLVRVDGARTVVNPGAIASGNEVSRQIHQTVALAWLTRGEPKWQIVHIGVSGAPQRWDATVDWDAGFAAASARYQRSILDPALAAQLPMIMAQTPPGLLRQLRVLVFELAHKVWAGELPRLTMERVLREAQAGGVLSADDAARLQQLASQQATQQAPAPDPASLNSTPPF